ncbi:MAG: hypothetical protein KI793_20910 [Rivularia sp. (in: Bacteria)]|nr:hypothetical protein [Rivularia sp. MS3]
MFRQIFRLIINYWLLSLSLTLAINAKVEAQTQPINNSLNSTSQPNQEQRLDNQQQNAAAINQTGVYNVGESATYKIQGLGGRQVICPKPSLIIGSSYNTYDGISFDDNASYGVNAAFIIPLGGKVAKTCEQMAETISSKTKYDLEIINARACAELIGAGVRLNPESFPTLSNICKGVSLYRKSTNEPKSSRRFEPQKLPKYKYEAENNNENKEN